jgi:hypothetical protein
MADAARRDLDPVAANDDDEVTVAAGPVVFLAGSGAVVRDLPQSPDVDARTLASMAWTLRREGCHNINWVGGEVVIHLHAIVGAIALLGRDFTPGLCELEQARRTKADRFLSFEQASEFKLLDRLPRGERQITLVRAPDERTA